MLKNKLSFKEVFKKNGKQGVVGIFVNQEDKQEVVFKFSQYFNHLVKHEHLIANSLKEISGYCPNFCKSLGTITEKVDSN